MKEKYGNIQRAAKAEGALWMFPYLQLIGVYPKRAQFLCEGFGSPGFGICSSFLSLGSPSFDLFGLGFGICSSFLSLGSPGFSTSGLSFSICSLGLSLSLSETETALTIREVEIFATRY